MTTEVRSMSTEDLVQMIDETEHSLLELKMELRRRRQAQQHAEIERLDEHLANAKITLGGLKLFFQTVLDELRGGSKTS